MCLPSPLTHKSNRTKKATKKLYLTQRFLSFEITHIFPFTKRRALDETLCVCSNFVTTLFIVLDAQAQNQY